MLRGFGDRSASCLIRRGRLSAAGALPLAPARGRG